MFSLGGSVITVATVFPLLVLGFVYVTNDNDISSMDEFYTAALVGTISLTLAIPLVPPIEDLATTSDLMRSLTIAIIKIRLFIRFVPRRAGPLQPLAEPRDTP